MLQYVFNLSNVRDCHITRGLSSRKPTGNRLLKVPGVDCYEDLLRSVVEDPTHCGLFPVCWLQVLCPDCNVVEVKSPNLCQRGTAVLKFRPVQLWLKDLHPSVPKGRGC